MIFSIGILAVLVGLLGSRRHRKNTKETVHASLGGVADALRLLVYGVFALIFIYIAGLMWHSSGF